MSCFLFSNDDDNLQKINIDELYDKNQRRDLKQISIFNKNFRWHEVESKPS